MNRFLILLVFGMAVSAGCSTSPADEPFEEPTQRIAQVQQMIKGVWKWDSDPRYELRIGDGRSYYVNDGKVDGDTATYNLSGTLCNPKAAYQIASVIVSSKPMVYYETIIYEDGLKYKEARRCWSVMAISQDTLKLFETHMGTIVQFFRAKS